MTERFGGDSRVVQLCADHARRRAADPGDQDPTLAHMLDGRAGKLASSDYHPVAIDDITERLTRLFAQNLHPAAKVSGLRRLAGGASKEQFLFTLDAPCIEGSEQLVVRMDPTDGVLETSRQREFEILEAMQGVVPVPRPRFLDHEGTWLGASGMITSFEQGSTKPPQAGAGVSGLGTGFTPQWRERLGPQFLRLMAAIHRFDFRAAGLRHFAIPDADPFQAARQRVNLWARVWREGAYAPIPGFAVVESWLRSNLPAARELVLVHGDFRTGNYLFDGDSGEITAILDWELAHVGDYHEDLAWSLVEIFGARDEQGRYLCSNLMTVEDFIGGYERETGRIVDRDTLRFYRILLSWSVVAMASSGLTAAANRHNHQDILLTWLSMVTHPLLDEITRLMLEEKAA
jgi:aminoglycoside phosphotransferase (APT) family kinase protein